jgi:hypothetical protein
MSNKKIAVEVISEDAIHYDSDILVLKYAQSLYGLDRTVASIIEQDGSSIQNDLPKSGKYLVVDTPEGIMPPKVIFIGTQRLWDFGYKEIREFGRLAISSLLKSKLPIKHISLTIHGAGYGLDEEEAFSSQLAGIIDAVTSGQLPIGLRKITFLERTRRRGSVLQRLLNELLPGACIKTDPQSIFGGTEDSSKQTLREAGYTSENKPHVFVAMPFKDDMEDVWDYGIQPTVKSAGYICERADLSSFTGNVMDWVRKRIKTAEIVIADLTESNPNVYLEVGYAWGVGIPTILLMNNGSELKFDVQGQRCLKYKRIKDLEKLLEKELAELERRNNV